MKYEATEERIYPKVESTKSLVSRLEKSIRSKECYFKEETERVYPLEGVEASLLEDSLMIEREVSSFLREQETEAFLTETIIDAIKNKIKKNRIYLDAYCKRGFPDASIGAIWAEHYKLTNALEVITNIERGRERS